MLNFNTRFKRVNCFANSLIFLGLKVKKRRLERELERQQREEELQMLQRNKEAAQFEEWERQEDQFHLEQARLRSHIRIQDGRGNYRTLLFFYHQKYTDFLF